MHPPVTPLQILRVSACYQCTPIRADQPVNYGIRDTEMKHYYPTTMQCFEIHRRQAERVSAEKDSDPREIPRIKAARGRPLLGGNGLTRQVERQRDGE